MAKYLYNGVELPDINEVWTDKVTYPYAVVSKDTFDESNSKYSFVLYLCSERPVTILQDDTYHVHFAPAGSKLLISIMVTSQTLYDEMVLQGHGSELGLNCWGNPLSVDTANDYNCSWIDNKIWANYDILYSDGSVYLAASDHVPVEDETVTTKNADLYIKKGNKLYKVKCTGGGLPEVVLTTSVDMGTTFTDEENAALTAALATGKPVILKCTIMEQPDVAMTMNNFSGQGFVATYANVNILLMTDGENWSAFVEELRVLPEVTEDDNGKFLQVVNGAFALVEKSTILGTSGQVVLTTANWSNGAYTFTAYELGENDAIFFTPATKADKTALEDAGVFIGTTGQIVTLEADTTPTANITLYYFIVRGA